MAKHRLLKLACLLAPALAACAQVPPDAGLIAAQPVTDPAGQVTPYSGALACLRQQLAMIGGRSQFISVGMIPDATGRITPGTRDMVSAAVVAATGGNVRYIPTEAATIAGLAGMPIGTTASSLGVLIGPPATPQAGLALPANAALVAQSMQVIGSLSQADKAVQQSGLQGGLAACDNSIGAGSTSDYGAVTLDLRLVDVPTGVILQTTSNMLVVRNSGRSANAALRIGSFGVSFDASFDRREGPHQAVRTLGELSVVELLGRQARVPYWTCLAVDNTHPSVREQVRTWYQAMTPAELDLDVRSRLRGLGISVPAIPAAANAELAEFQQRNGLVPNGRPTFETYAALIGARLPLGASVTPGTDMPPPAVPASPRQIKLDVTEGRSDGKLQLRVTRDRGGFLACYYRDGVGHIVQLYPNRSQPEAAPAADMPVMIPPSSDEAAFLIQPQGQRDRVGFLCAASDRDLSPALPPALHAEDFGAIAASSLSEIASAYRAAGGSDVAVTEASRAGPASSWHRL